MVAFLQGDRKIYISSLTQSTAENAEQCVYCESASTYEINENLVEKRVSE